MPIDVIRATGTKERAVHMVRAGSEMVIKEGRNSDGVRVTVYSAMGICGTEATGAISQTEKAKDVTCKRCAGRASRELTPPEPAVSGSHGWDKAPVLSTPETVREPRSRVYTPGRERHGRIRHERAERRRQMKAMVHK